MYVCMYMVIYVVVWIVGCDIILVQEPPAESKSPYNLLIPAKSTIDTDIDTHNPHNHT